jgi:hypothetical protein
VTRLWLIHSLASEITYSHICFIHRVSWYDTKQNILTRKTGKGGGELANYIFSNNQQNPTTKYRLETVTAGLLAQHVSPLSSKQSDTYTYHVPRQTTICVSLRHILIISSHLCWDLQFRYSDRQSAHVSYLSPRHTPSKSHPDYILTIFTEEHTAQIMMLFIMQFAPVPRFLFLPLRSQCSPPYPVWRTLGLSYTYPNVTTLHELHKYWHNADGTVYTHCLTF